MTDSTEIENCVDLSEAKQPAPRSSIQLAMSEALSAAQCFINIEQLSPAIHQFEREKRDAARRVILGIINSALAAEVEERGPSDAALKDQRSSPDTDIGLVEREELAALAEVVDPPLGPGGVWTGSVIKAATETISSLTAKLGERDLGTTASPTPGILTTGDHSSLRAANVARQKEWACGAEIPLSFRGVELAGEVGEACNIIKKIERERIGIRGSHGSVGDLADELADVVICADLVALDCGIDLETAIRRKFNWTSEKVGLATRMAATRSGGITSGETPEQKEVVVPESKLAAATAPEGWGGIESALKEIIRDCTSRAYHERFNANAWLIIDSIEARARHALSTAPRIEMDGGTGQHCGGKNHPAVSTTEKGAAQREAEQQ
jgi:NTP pyrophosphatase (non-canonical NTP hydrolase)